MDDQSMDDQADIEPAAPIDPLASRFERLRAASRAEPYPERALREDRLRRLEAMTDAAARRITAAISDDFGWRAPVETEMAEILFTISGARHARRRLRRWMAPRRAPTALQFWPLANRVLPQPLGVVGILSPWNYPYQLAVAPLIAAFAAGNRALLKPSERTPATAALLAELIAERFEPDEVAVALGGPETAAAVAALPFDHLFFTGSTAIGRRVAQAAAANLTPVTLELGGKSPAIVDETADLAQAAEKIAYGKWLNAGQTCIAPDYALVPPLLIEAFADALTAATRRLYPDLGADYTSLIDARAAARLKGLLDAAAADGARLQPLFEGVPPGKFAPTLVLDPPAHGALMREEIFGPVLPIVPCADLDAAIARLRDQDRPLALYWFGADQKREARLLRETWSGGAMINDTVLQVAQEDLPFGGVGASGMGAYHGRAGFDRLSHLKAVSRRGWGPDGARLAYPPYGPRTRRLLELMRRWL